MRRSHRVVALLSLAALTVGGCAAISGLSQITEQECAPNCDGSVAPSGDGGTPPPTDGTAPTDDATIGMDAGPPGMEDSPAGEDAPMTSHDSGGGGSDDGAVAESGADASSSDAGIDAPVAPPVDASCGPVDTIENCSACGEKCAPNNASSPACSGTTCSYTCNANYLDCNRGNAPDLDGCECNAPGAELSQCCGAACPVQHHYETIVASSTFYDCVPSGTFTLALAMDACNAYADDDGGVNNVCNVLDYTFSCIYADGGTAGDLVCSNGSTKPCACWGYDGVLPGVMGIGTGSGVVNPNNCPCPEQAGITPRQWN